MQELAGETGGTPVSPAIHHVARHRVAERREVDADLVGASRLEAHVDEREPGQAFVAPGNG